MHLFAAGVCHSQEWNGPFTQPSAYCSRLMARYTWMAWVIAWHRCAVPGKQRIPTATSISRMGSCETCLGLVLQMENDRSMVHRWFCVFRIKVKKRLRCVDSIVFVRWFMLMCLCMFMWLTSFANHEKCWIAGVHMNMMHLKTQVTSHQIPTCLKLLQISIWWICKYGYHIHLDIDPGHVYHFQVFDFNNYPLAN